MNKDLTILILLKDDSPFTFRWMRYYNQAKLPFKVLIADGGKDKSVEKLANKSLYPNLDYEYIRFPYDENVPAFYKKVAEALGKIKTKYVLLGSNDDFYLADSVSKSIKFLNENPDYVAARGDIYSFQVKPGEEGAEKEVYGQMISLHKLYKDPSNDEGTALGRIRHASEFSNSLWHEVCHAEAMKYSYDTLLESGVIDLDLGDRLVNYILSTKGKVHRDTHLHMLHQSRGEGLGNVLSKRNPFEWMLSESWGREVNKIFDIVAEEVSKKDEVGAEEARNKVMQYYLTFIIGKKMLKERIEREIKNRPWKIPLLKGVIQKIKSLKDVQQSQKIMGEFLKNKDFKHVYDFLIQK